MTRAWTPKDILDIASAYKAACVLAAGVELDVFAALAAGPETAAALAKTIDADPRATAVLLDALAAMQLLEKQGDRYSVAPGVAELLTADGSQTVLNMARHHANCMRRWTQLAHVVRNGQPAERCPSIRGEQADHEAFITAMDDISKFAAQKVVDNVGPLQFSHLLDVGGASGTWTMALLRAAPKATATLFDLPGVIPMAKDRLARAGMLDRVRLVAGDFSVDELPAGADLALVSAIVHMNSREENRQLFAKVAAALVAGGQILIRDVVMDETRTQPVGGALFAINMLVATSGGGTFTFDELREDLEASGFAGVTLLCRDEFMDSVVRAVKPA